MVEGKGRVLETETPERMAAQAKSFASQALDVFDVLDYKSIAGYIKTELDKMYGPGWQCMEGSKFGCFCIHKKGTFINFSLDKLEFVAFKAAAAAAAA